MAINRQIQSIFRVLIAVFAIYMVTSSWGLLTKIENLITPCDTEASLIENSDKWQITESSLSAQIIWQKVEPITRPIIHLGTSSTGFIASNGNILYWQISGSQPCDKQPIIAAFDTETGREAWRYRPQAVTTKLFAVADGYILIDVSEITKLDFQGHEVWQQASFRDIPIRAFSTMYEVGDSLFFPARSGKTYEISSENGELIGDEDLGEVIAIFDYFVLRQSGNSSLELIDLSKNHQILYSIDFPDDTFLDIPLNPNFPFAVRNQDTLLLYFNSTSFEVHDFNTGELLWEYDKPLLGVPVLTNDVLVIYSLDDTLEIFDPQSGKLLGNVALTGNTGNYSNTSRDVTSRTSTWITGYQENIYIRQIDNLELIAVKLDLSNILTE